MGGGEQSDLALVLGLADTYGKDVCVVGNKVYVKELMTHNKEDIIYEWGKSLISFRVKENIKEQVSKVHMFGWNWREKREFRGEVKVSDIAQKIGGRKDWMRVSKGGSGHWVDYHYCTKAKDSEEAKVLALALMRQKSFKLLRAEGSGEGNCKLSSGAMVTVKYVGTAFSGDYIAECVVHRFSLDEGFITDFYLKRNMVSDEYVRLVKGRASSEMDIAHAKYKESLREEADVQENENHEPLRCEILSVECLDKNGNQTTTCLADEPMTFEAVCNASVKEGATVTFNIYREGDDPQQAEPVETLTANVQQGKAQVKLDHETMGKIIGGVLGGLAGGETGTRIGQAIGRNLGRSLDTIADGGARVRRFFATAFTTGTKEAQSECVEVEESAKVELLTTVQINSNWGGKWRVVPLTDIETGQTFNISWNFHSRHTDWSPMTSNDTTIIKKILRPSVAANDTSWTNLSSWSWNARPGIITIESRRVAVGFHLFPHGSILGGAKPGSPLSSQSDKAPADGSGWTLGGHMCMYYGDSTGGGDTNWTERMNNAARDAYRRGR